MRKVYKDLTEDQKLRGVMFSSALIPKDSTEEPKVHEVFLGEADQRKTIERLLDDDFFGKSGLYKHNLVRQ